MPFPDELSPGGVAVVPYRDVWVAEASELARSLAAAVPGSLAVEHVGSTSVPGMAAKDCLDLMVVVENLTNCGAENGLTRLGYRRRPEPWNELEQADGRDWPKLTFAPPVGARPCNVHVRTAGSGTLRLALLFRDHLRDQPHRTRWWSELKIRAARATSDLHAYGRIKYPAWLLLMELAETWADRTGWTPPSYPVHPAGPSPSTREVPRLH